MMILMTDELSMFSSFWVSSWRSFGYEPFSLTSLRLCFSRHDEDGVNGRDLGTYCKASTVFHYSV